MNIGKQKKSDNAARCYAKAVKHFQQGKLEDAAREVKRSLRMAPEFADAIFMLGIIESQRGKTEDAIRLIGSAIRKNAGRPSYHYNFGVILHSAGRLQDAMKAYQVATGLKPDFAEAHSNLAGVLSELSRHVEALHAADRAIHVNPRLANAFANKGNALKGLGRYDEAITAYRRSLALSEKGSAEVFFNLGIVMEEAGRIREALDAYHQATQIAPDFPKAHCNHGFALMRLGQPANAVESYKRAIEAGPGYRKAHDNLLFTMNYLPGLTQVEIYEAHRRWGADQTATSGLAGKAAHPSAGQAGHPLRIGYVSPDFYTHSVAYFFEALLDARDRDVFSIACYSNVEKPDLTTERLKKKVDQWVPIEEMSDEAVAEKIRQDEIDILVDLAGHTAGNRLAVFASKPAPIQVTWLGYPNTTGLETIDYRITDHVADPVGESDLLHTEKLVRIDGPFLCYRPSRDAPDVSVLPAIDAGYVTFGSFNNISKINPAVIRVWSDILHAVSGSRILLKDGAFSDDKVRENFLKQFSVCDVGPERIDFQGKLPKTREHLNYYERVDVALDTFPYNGTTTTCEAMWMGVPVITLKGDRHAARVGASILAHSGFGFLVGSSFKDYVNISTKLAADIERLRNVRVTLRDALKESVICNVELFARSMENAYRQMYYAYLGAV